MTMRLISLLFLTSTMALAGSWSGLLVDASCYTSEQQNANRYLGTADRDMNFVIRQCSPNDKTKNFAVVLKDWDSLSLDANGNAEAAKLVQNANKRVVTGVTVTGELQKHTIQVASVSPR
jgi:hypothetical protein